MTNGDLPTFIFEIARQLRRRHLSLGVYDYDALRRALSAGFGLSSHDELCRLCIALWAKSPEEAGIIRAVFNRSDVDPWNVSERAQPELASTVGGLGRTEGGSSRVDHYAGGRPPQAEPVRDLAGSPPPTGVIDRRLVTVPQYPVTEREVAQAWRRLRRPLRTGPAVELDIAATVAQYSRRGVAALPVLVPRRRNTAKLLLLIDRFGSMTPFHGYVSHIVHAIRSAGRLDDVREAYFHDLPGGAPDRTLLANVEDPFRPDLDSVLPLVQPMADGWVYDDPQLTASHPLLTTLDQLAGGTAAVVISDAGAARQRLNTMRLLDTIAFLKAIQTKAGTVAWLNPLQPDGWARNTAGQIARHVPMYPLTREGLDRAVNALRGHPTTVERPL